MTVTVSRPTRWNADKIDHATLKHRAGLKPYHDRLRLKKQGPQNLIANCIWHKDTRPSLVVYPDGHHHCFSCGAHGDCIDLIQQADNCTFREAVRKLEDLVGVPHLRVGTPQRRRSQPVRRIAPSQFDRQLAHDIAELALGKPPADSSDFDRLLAGARDAARDERIARRRGLELICQFDFTHPDWQTIDRYCMGDKRADELLALSTLSSEATQ